MTLRAALIVTVQTGVVPKLAHASAQPANFELLNAVAVSVTCVFGA